MRWFNPKGKNILDIFDVGLECTGCLLYATSQVNNRESYCNGASNRRLIIWILLADLPNNANSLKHAIVFIYLDQNS